MWLKSLSDLCLNHCPHCLGLLTVSLYTLTRELNSNITISTFTLTEVHRLDNKQLAIYGSVSRTIWRSSQWTRVSILSNNSHRLVQTDQQIIVTASKMIRASLNDRAYTRTDNTSVCLSVRPSVTRWYPIQMNEDRIMRSLLWGSKNIPFFWYQQWLGAMTPST